MLLDETPLEAGDEQQYRSPADVLIGIRKELAEFQQNGNKQAFRERLRAELREACKAALNQTGDRSAYPDIAAIVEYLEDRGLIRLNSRRNRKAAKTANGHLA